MDALPNSVHRYPSHVARCSSFQTDRRSVQSTAAPPTTLPWTISKLSNLCDNRLSGVEKQPQSHRTYFTLPRPHFYYSSLSPPPQISTTGTLPRFVPPPNPLIVNWSEWWRGWSRWETGQNGLHHEWMTVFRCGYFFGQPIKPDSSQLKSSSVLTAE